MLLCDRCRAADRGDRPIQPVAVVAGSMGSDPIRFDGTAQLCPDCRTSLRQRLVDLIAEFRAGQMPTRDDGG